MDTIFSRTELLIGKEGIDRLKQKKVAVIGIGGVGSWVAEALTRAGVSNIVIVDPDTVATTDINRQILALHSTIGLPKVEVMKKRLLDINPKLHISAIDDYFDTCSSERILCGDLDYVIDAIDTMGPKVHLIYRCKELGIPVISAMGAGNKLDPTEFKIADLSKTSVCPVARIMRRELRKLGVESGVKVVYSEEPPKRYAKGERSNTDIPGSISFVPPTMALIMAGEVIRELLK